MGTKSVISKDELSISKRVSEVFQPRGGYLRPSQFEKISFSSNVNDLNTVENISFAQIGLVVDHLTKFTIESSVEEAFADSIEGAKVIGEIEKGQQILKHIVGINDDKSIQYAAMMTGYDIILRADSFSFKSVDSIRADKNTCENIHEMVMRSTRFFDRYGPIEACGLTFEGGYTEYVCSGKSGFVTHDTLWDLKVSKQRLLPRQTLELLVRWRMGLHSVHRTMFSGIRYLGVYNPRADIASRVDIRAISELVIDTVDHEIIGYKTE